MRIKRSGVYQIMNEVNGKFYIGSSVDITNRWGHWRAAVKKDLRYKSILKDAFQKYGIENFTFILLEECESTKEALEALEQHYIDTLKPVYNILPKAYSGIGGKGSLGHKQTDDEKQKHREAAIQLMTDPEIRKSISKKMQEYRANVPYQGANVKGSKRHAETGDNISKALRGSESFKAYAEGKRGKANLSCSVSGEYGIRLQHNNWCAMIDGKSYGSFPTIEEALKRRDEIMSLPIDIRPMPKVGRTSTSGHKNVVRNGVTDRWVVKIGNKQHGSFSTIEEAVARRDIILNIG